MIWRPNVTVAAVIERAGRFLMVDENTDEGRLLNQPAGHLEPNETLLDAVARETLEESGYRFAPHYLVGIYHWRHPKSGITYLRFTFGGDVDASSVAPLETTTLATPWMTAEALRSSRDRHRGPQVLSAVEDYLAGRRFPLELLTTLA